MHTEELTKLSTNTPEYNIIAGVSVELNVTFISVHVYDCKPINFA